MILVHGQIPRYARPDHSWPKYSLVGNLAKPIPPSPFLPGFTAVGGGGHGDHRSYLIDKTPIGEKRYRQDADEMLALLLTWLLVTNNMPWLIPETPARPYDDDELLALISMWLEVT